MKASTNYFIDRRNFNVGLIFAPLAAAFVPKMAAAAQPDDAQNLLSRAHTTFDTALHDREFGTARDIAAQAKAVMVVPQLVKAGFFLGGEGGDAVLVKPVSSGWTNPLFYTLGSASFGLQIGVEVAEVVLFVMNERALRAWAKDEVTLGAKAGLTVLVVGSNAAASATTNGNVDVIAWAKAKGAYAGITLEGSLIKPRNEWNTAYYGHPVNPGQVLSLPSRAS